MMERFWGEERWIQRAVTFVIRSDRAATESFLAEVRQAVWSANPNLPVYFVRTLKEVYDRSMSRTSFTLVTPFHREPAKSASAWLSALNKANWQECSCVMV
jgi:hypothetical protein